MSIFDASQTAGEAAARKVIEDEIASLTGLISAGTAQVSRLQNDLASEQLSHSATRSLLSTELARHRATKDSLDTTLGLLDSANAAIATLKLRVKELEAQHDVVGIYDPVSFKTLEEAIAYFDAPKDAVYVTWRWGDDVMLEQAFMEMNPGEILVLPERDKPYLLDTADGFRAAGVTSIDYSRLGHVSSSRTGTNVVPVQDASPFKQWVGKQVEVTTLPSTVTVFNRKVVAFDETNNTVTLDGEPFNVLTAQVVTPVGAKGGSNLPIKSSYRGKTARTWFALARARRGILAMGPGAKIELAPSSLNLGQQAPQNEMIVRPSGQVLSSATFRLIEAEDTSSETFFANFTAIGRDLGGAAYSGISQKNGRAHRIRFRNFNRGFLGLPNGETGALSFNGRYSISNMEISGRDYVTGKRAGTSPIMINSSPGGTIKDVYVHETYAGGITTWNSYGKHRWDNVRTFGASGINLEANREGFEFEWVGGENYIDYKHTGEWPELIDANYKGNTSLHSGVRSPYASQKILIRGVKFDKGPKPGYWSIQGYSAGPTEPKKQLPSDIRVFEDLEMTKPVPVQIYGAIASGI